jgi:hypothetical protein
LNESLKLLMTKNQQQEGQSLLELVVGVGMLTIVVSGIAVVTLSSLRNTQYSKNQVQATKLAQQNMEIIRTIKNSNFGVCLQSDPSPQGSSCTAWENIWDVTFGVYSSPAGCSITSCTFNIMNNGCTVRTGAATTEVKPICLGYSAARGVGTGALSSFTTDIIIEDEAVGQQKKITSKAYWMDPTGEHSSNLVTVLSKY